MPRTVTVVVREREGSPVGSLLVHLNTYVAGNYYFGDMLGMTDATGRVMKSGNDIERDFDENRRLFMMDYKVALVECDAMLGVGIAGGSEFLSARAQTADLDYVSNDVKAWYRTAKNLGYGTTEARHRQTSEDSPDIELLLVVQQHSQASDSGV